MNGYGNGVGNTWERNKYRAEVRGLRCMSERPLTRLSGDIVRLGACVLWLGGTRRATLVLLGMNVGIRTGEKAPNLEDVRQREAASG